jgi:1,4-alpha-glucan branching enzyme
LPEGETVEPKSVEIAGSFTNWKRVPLQHDARQGSWHGSIPNIPGGKTHHYMLLVDGKPTFDKACDGYAIPQGAQEEAFQLQTERGGRVLMLFAKAK